MREVKSCQCPEFGRHYSVFSPRAQRVYSEYSLAPMKHLFASAALLFLSLSASRAVEDLTVLPPLVDGVAPTALLEEQLKKETFAALDRRVEEYEKIKTSADVVA